MDTWARNLGSLGETVEQAADRWDATDGTSRLWQKDASLWTGADEGRWLGWLEGPRLPVDEIEELTRVAEQVRADGFTDILLLGMGGSSLCPEVLAETYGVRAGWPRLHVLDSTDPTQVRETVAAVDLARTIVIVASKSGSTLEPNIFYAYVRNQMETAVGAVQAGGHFVAITDPGSKLETVAARDGFRHVFKGEPSIGGRYSALSPFGLVPAALIGLDLRTWIAEASRMADACGPGRGVADNPGVQLGLALGAGANCGRDKLTLIVSPAIYDLGAWLEQLIAESTGKKGRSIIPIDREPLGPPTVYAQDRLFAYVRLRTTPDAGQDAAVEALRAAGYPLIRIDVSEPASLAAEFFRWEIATAVAGAVMGINPFDQPDVEASKVETRKLTDDVERTGSLPAETPVVDDHGFRLFTDAANAAALQRAASATTADAWLRAHLDRLGSGDYLALLAYVPMTAPHEERLQRIRTRVRDHRHVATCVGFGPRFLHSTGQAYKGGPDTGVFLQITCDDPVDLEVPGTRYTFGTVKAAQARGDFQVLVDRGRRALRLHVGADVAAALDRLDAIVASTLS